jgi:hypothetical protein
MNIIITPFVQFANNLKDLVVVIQRLRMMGIDWISAPDGNTNPPYDVISVYQNIFRHAVAYLKLRSRFIRY